MKITVFNDSPSAEQSNTNVIVEAFLKGARLGGDETENIFLIEKNIEHCKGCFSCWFKTPGNNNFTTMKEIFKYCNPILEIYRNCRRLLKSKDEKVKMIVNDYLKYVKQAGYEIVTQDKISYDTRVNLEKNLISLDEYINLLGMQN